VKTVKKHVEFIPLLQAGMYVPACPIYSTPSPCEAFYHVNGLELGLPKQ